MTTKIKLDEHIEELFDDEMKDVLKEGGKLLLEFNCIDKSGVGTRGRVCVDKREHGILITAKEDEVNIKDCKNVDYALDLAFNMEGFINKEGGL